MTRDMRETRAEGYVTELAYTPGYHPELDPRAVMEALAREGFEHLAIERACELGFGRGLSLAIHAVAGEASWWGNDLLTVHVQELEALTRGLTDRLHVTAETFEEFCSREDLPGFELIALHGIWSWVSARNRDIIRQFIARRLAPRGIVYLSYNTRAGWASMVPLREFLVAEAGRPEYADRPLIERIEAALVAAQRVVAQDLPPARDDPMFEKHLRAIRYQSKSYLAHEYFNRDWTLFDETEIRDSLQSLGLDYATQARPTSATPRLRRDLWVRGLSRGVPPSRGVLSSAANSLDLSQRFDAVYELNQRLLERAQHDPQQSVLGSPVTGGGIELGWRGVLALAAWRWGAREADSISAFVLGVLDRLGHPYVHEGVVIGDRGEVAVMLQREARTFLAATLPRLVSLGIERG